MLLVTFEYTPQSKSQCRIYTIESFVLRPVNPFFLAGLWEVEKITDDRLWFRAGRKRRVGTTRDDALQEIDTDATDQDIKV